uniref:Lipase n=1 Tax=Rhabditophanes sp. KR3021 TaxID=114890 RepID=A0AC35TQL9_9BILA
MKWVLVPFVGILSFVFVGSVIVGPITADFTNWLNRNGYQEYNFARKDFGTAGSYGGRLSKTQQVNKIPIVMIHGNSDGGLTLPGNYSTGFTSTISYFQSKGYTSAELYVTTWGDRNSSMIPTRTHSCQYVTFVRQFMEAVIKYTGKQKINVISHSMGVTLARKAIAGTMEMDHDNYSAEASKGCMVGKKFNEHVNVFIGAGGANYGICFCTGDKARLQPTCNQLNGFFPGDKCQSVLYSHTIHNEADLCYLDRSKLICLEEPKYSTMLSQLNNNHEKPGRFVYSFWTPVDEVLGNGNMVYGRITSHIPNSDGIRIFNEMQHEDLKDKTIYEQYAIMSNHEDAGNESPHQNPPSPTKKSNHDSDSDENSEQSHGHGHGHLDPQTTSAE